MFSKNKQKRIILIFTGSLSALVGAALLVIGIVLLVDTRGDIFAWLMLALGVFIMWISFREFKEYHQLKRETDQGK
jgi:zinc transporter ZupT